MTDVLDGAHSLKGEGGEFTGTSGTTFREAREAIDCSSEVVNGREESRKRACSRDLKRVEARVGLCECGEFADLGKM